MTILFDGRFTHGADIDDYTQWQTNGATGTDASLIPAGRIELVSLDGETACRFTVADSDELAANGNRTEIRGPSVTIGGEYWYSWHTYVPEGFGNDRVLTLDQLPNFAVGQFHQAPDGGEYSSPPMPMLYDAGKMVIRSYYDEGATSTSESYTRRTLASFRCLPGAWRHFVLHVLWDASSSGFIEMWCDRRLVASETGQANCADNSEGPYPKLGVYNFGSLASYGTRQIFSKGIVCADDTSQSFDAFMAEIGHPELTELEIVLRSLACPY